MNVGCPTCDLLEGFTGCWDARISFPLVVPAAMLNPGTVGSTSDSNLRPETAKMQAGFGAGRVGAPEVE